jgi:hypothetical protein
MSEELMNEVLEQEIQESEVIDNEIQEEVQGEETPINKDDYIPKNIALQWKKDLKELKKQVSQYKFKEIEESQKTKLENIKRMVIDKGYDEDVAHLFGEMAHEISSIIPKSGDPITEEVDEELSELSESIPNITKYKKDIIEKVRKYRKADPDFSVDDAIRLIGINSKGNKSTREIELEIEQRNLLARRNGETEPTPSSSGSVKENYPLSQDDLRTLKTLQQAHPDRGWTKKKYYEIMIKNKRR